jgi:hypothetical protein
VLPSTLDPFAVLGLRHDAGVHDVDAAYARLRRVHDPRRDPDDFDRLHAAYDLARELAAAAPGPPPTAGRDGDRAAEVAATLRAGRREDVAPVIADALDLGLPLDALLAPLPVELRTEVVASPALSWARLRPQLAVDRAVVAAVLLDRFEALIAERRTDEVAAALSDEVLRADADTDAAVAIPALRAIGGLVWRGDQAPRLLRDYASLPDHLGVARLHRGVARELELATRWRRVFGDAGLRGGPLRPAHAIDLPAPLVSLVADAALASPRARRGLVVELERLIRDPWRMVGLFDTVAAADPELVPLILARFRAQAPRGGRRLADLPTATVAALDAELVAVERRVHSRIRPWMLATSAAVASVATAVAILPGAIAAGVIGTAVGLRFRFGGGARRYERLVRSDLAAVVARHGVSPDVIRAWIDADRARAGDLSAFASRVADDRALALLGGLAALVRIFDEPA